MAIVLSGVGLICALIGLVCFILVVVQMFKHNQTGLGVACILLIFCGIGYLIAFVVGWIRAKEWNISNVMVAWTVAFIIAIVMNVLVPVMGNPQPMAVQAAPSYSLTAHV